MKGQLNEVQQLQKLAGILKEDDSEFEYDKVTELPKVDLEKLSRVLDMLVNYGILKPDEKKVLIDVIKNIPKYLHNEKKLTNLSNLIPSIDFHRLNKKRRLVFEPLEGALYDIMFSDESFNTKSTLLSAYTRINNFLSKIK